MEYGIFEVWNNRILGDCVIEIEARISVLIIRLDR